MLNNLCKSMRKTMRESMWENSVFFSTNLKNIMFYIFTLCKSLEFHRVLNINYHNFSTNKNSISSLFIQCFSQFPHSLLLLLLIKSNII